MIQLPPLILTLYRTAGSPDVRTWSYGIVKLPRPAGATAWQQNRGTLDDQAIFGPLTDYACACGRFKGFDHNGTVCPFCGVKIASSQVRRQRFAHVELSAAIAHPLGPGQPLEAFPILPAAFFGSPGGTPLAELYDELLLANASRDGRLIARAAEAVCELLTGVFIQANDWNLSDAHALARGLALEHRPAAGGDDDRCDHCGYPLAGLNAVACPHCGHKVAPRD